MNIEVCAAIVTYHPDADFERTVGLLRPQVGRMVVVDNYSGDTEIEKLRTLAEKFDFALIKNPDNYGLGRALNQSIEWAKEHTSCEFILFLDQDSFVSENFAAAMVGEYRKHPAIERIFLVTPAIVHRRTGEKYIHATFGGKCLVAQTSGSLVPLQVFASEGIYREDLFIDYVDYEFCLRLASRGWRIACCEHALLDHDPGSAKQFSVLGVRKVTVPNYSPLRRYYLMRNGIWTIREYRAAYPEWAADQAWQMLKGVVRVLLFEENRASTLRMWFLAIKDAIRSRSGKYPCDG
ncbi:MAG: glycosyltransferase family 2 protein, partial [Candidatus Sulfotelmatobacter sp.]